MADKRISEEKVREIINKNKEIVTASGATISNAEQEMEKIKEELMTIDRKISILL